MQSKVSRPAAQLKQLFASKQSQTAVGGLTSRLFGQSPITEQLAQATTTSGESVGDSSAHFGTVIHYGDSIAPPRKVKVICLASCGLFYANSTSILASAFRRMNAPAAPTLWEMIFIGLIIGAVYLPMPISLWLMRKVTRRNAHYSGLLLFGSFLLAGQMIIILSVPFPSARLVTLGSPFIAGHGLRGPFPLALHTGISEHK